jgi:hypothetical protein
MNALELTLLPFALYGLSRTRKAPPVSLTTAGLLYFAMTFVSFQAWPDTILFGPPLAALLAAGLTGAVALVLGPRWAPGVVLAVALIAAATPSAARLRPPITFAEQRTAMQEIAAGLSAADTVIAVSVPEFLLHTDRKSRWPWPYLWFGVDRFAARRRPGGFEAILEDLDRDPPALILVARHWAGPLRRRFTEWVERRYDRSVVRIYPHVARPIVVYRLRTRP